MSCTGRVSLHQVAPHRMPTGSTGISSQHNCMQRTLGYICMHSMLNLPLPAEAPDTEGV